MMLVGIMRLRSLFKFCELNSFFVVLYYFIILGKLRLLRMFLGISSWY